MAIPACFHLADDVFPRVRAECARRMRGQGTSQARIATTLGVSQAMVSKYLARDGAEADALVLRLADEVIAGIDTPSSGPSAWCGLLSQRQGSPHLGEAMEDLLAAEQRLLAANPLSIVPEVGLNIARAVGAAQGASDVLAYPARIVAAGDRMVRPVPPELGASNHLSTCLLALREGDPSIQAIANIRGLPIDADATLAGDGDRGVLFTAAVSGQDPVPRVVHDLGGIGIEPCIYIAGPTATAVVDRILTIAQVTT